MKRISALFTAFLLVGAFAAPAFAKEYTRTGGTMDLLNGSGLALDMITARAEALEKRLAR